MILLAALLCNYGRGFCLIDIGTEGFALDTAADEIAVLVQKFAGDAAPVLGRRAG